MRIYYFDDSGTRVLNPSNRNAPYFVLGGFGVDANRVPQLREAISHVAHSYGMRLDYPSEIKFHHIASRDSSKKPNWMIRSGLIDRNQRRAFVYSCLRHSLSIESAETICVAVNTSRLTPGQSAISTALTPLLERVDMSCRCMGTHALVMMDEERRDDSGLRTAMREGSPYFYRFNQLLDTISFIPSEESAGIQVADLVAGSFGRHMNWDDSGYLRTFARSSNGYPDYEGRGLKAYHRLDLVGSIPDRQAPWSDTDKRIHEYEIAAWGSSVDWQPNGTPNVGFPFDTDWK